MKGSVLSSNPTNTWARSRSMPPVAPAAFMAWASAVIRAMAAAAGPPGRLCPARLAVPSSSPYRLTPARCSASSRRRSAAWGFALMTARRSMDRSWPRVCHPALASTLSSTARASASPSTLVASAISRARERSIAPSDRAARVRGRRQASVTARSAHRAALNRDRRTASATSATASSGTPAGRPSGPTPTESSRAAARAVISATTASSPAAAQAASLRHASASPASATSSWLPGSVVASQPAIAGPGGSSSTTRPPSSPSDRQSGSAPSSGSGPALSLARRTFSRPVWPGQTRERPPDRSVTKPGTSSPVISPNTPAHSATRRVVVTVPTGGTSQACDRLWEHSNEHIRHFSEKPKRDTP